MKTNVFLDVTKLEFKVKKNQHIQTTNMPLSQPLQLLLYTSIPSQVNKLLNVKYQSLHKLMNY